LDAKKKKHQSCMSIEMRALDSVPKTFSLANSESSDSAIMPEPGKKGAAKAKQKSDDESSSDETDTAGEDQDSSRKTLTAPLRSSAEKDSSSTKISAAAKAASTKPAEAPTHAGAEINPTKKRRTTQSGGATVTATTQHTHSKAPRPAQRSNERFKRIDPEKYEAHVVGDNEYRAKVRVTKYPLSRSDSIGGDRVTITGCARIRISALLAVLGSGRRRARKRGAAIEAVKSLSVIFACFSVWLCLIAALFSDADAKPQLQVYRLECTTV
jgi:hypothetical protein